METQTVLITGATGGLGKAYAEAYAAQGASLILVARREQELNEIADALRGRHGVDVLVRPCDLCDAAARDALVAELAERQISVDVLVNNAGYGVYGDFAEGDADRQVGMVELNCVALTALAHAFLPGMVARRQGTLINVASTAAFQPLPHMAVYAATKAYVTSFSEALAAEVKGSGVTVVCICPGPTETPFWDVAEAGDVMTERRTSEQVVETTFKAVARGKVLAIDGAKNQLLARASKAMPFTIVEPIARFVVRRRR